MLRLLLVSILNLFVLVLYPLFWLRKRRAAPDGAWLEVNVDGPIVELARKLPFWERRSRALSLSSLRKGLELAAADARVRGFLFRIEQLSSGAAMATGLRDVMLAARRPGKRVAVYLPFGAGTSETYVASAADLVLVGPETHVAPLGFALGAPYLKRALDHAGIEPEVFARGRYKTAGEPLTAQRMSDAQKEQLGSVLDAAWEVLIDALAIGRRVDRVRAEHWVNSAPWSARQAVAEGLADATSYEDELKRKLEPRANTEPSIIRLERYARRRRIPWIAPFKRRRIAVIELHGPIVSRHVGPLPMAAEDQVREALEHAREQRGVAGAILHVDSRGGSAVASDRILHAVRRLAEKKPVVACFGDVAASGGYMAAVGAHAIVAQPNAITGSIGVVAARMVLSPLFDRLGITIETIKRGTRADMHSIARQLSPDERAVIERELDEVYRSFIEAVAQGRNRPLSEVEELAGGRVWSGRDAAAHGLVDRLGGFDVALSELRGRIGPGSERLDPVLFGHRHVRPRALRLARLVGMLEPLGLGRLRDLATLALGAPERVWLWSDIAERDLGRREGA